MTVARPTRTERNATAKARKGIHKPTRVTVGPWSFQNAVDECKAAGFELHEDAKSEWDKQTIRPSVRKMLMKNGRAICLNDIMNGHTRAVPLTVEEKAVTNAKKSASHKQLEHKQRHWLEVASSKAAMRMLDAYEQFETATVPDGLGTDFLIRCKGTELWAPIQVKSAVAHPDEHLQFSKLQSKDGSKGGRYEHVIILAVGVAPGCVPPDSSALFNTIADVEVKELLLFNRASDMPNNKLVPHPRRQASDIYGDHRYVVDFDTPERLNNMCTIFQKCIEKNARWSKSDAWYGPELNPSVADRHKTEVLNCKALGDLLGHDRLRAPNAQGETVDVVLELDNREVRISLKTATLNGKGFKFKLGKAVNSRFCDVVLAFYLDRKTQERTHVSVIAGKRVYVKGKKNFNWSQVHIENEDVWNAKIDLRAEDAAQQILKVLS